MARRQEHNAPSSPTTHTANGHERRAWWSTFPWVGVWGLVVGLNAPVQAQAPDLLLRVNDLLGQQLEYTFRYQEAVEPEGMTSIKRCLRVGKRDYVVEDYTDEAQSVGRTKELYLLQAGADTVSICTARFLLGHEAKGRGKTACVGVFHRYFTPLTIEAGQVLVVRNFSPAAFLALEPDLVPTGQTLYVLNEGPDVRGDTLACYRLTRASSGNVSLTLEERRTAANRRWHHNTRLTYQWEADLAQHQVTAYQVLADGTPGLQWVRKYTNRTDFTENQFSFSPPERDGDGMVKQEFYHREFRQLSPQQAQDRYKLTLPIDPVETVTFDIMHYYR